MQCPKAAIFDLDETLAPSFIAPRPEMCARLSALIERIPVAIMSGAGFDRIHRDVVSNLPSFSANLSLFPNSSSQCYMLRDGDWHIVYNDVLSEDERARIKDAIKLGLTEIPELKETQTFGQQIFDRESQVAFTAVGMDAPPEYKAAWDPTGEKRQRIARRFLETMPEFDILIGGASTIDFTRKETNKAHGVRWYANHLGLEPADMLFVGDALFPGGNDEVVIPTGIQTRAVAHPLETETVIDELLAVCKA